MRIMRMGHPNVPNKRHKSLVIRCDFSRYRYGAQNRGDKHMKDGMGS